jgi:hypothetical protein
MFVYTGNRPACQFSNRSQTGRHEPLKHNRKKEDILKKPSLALLFDFKSSFLYVLLSFFAVFHEK